MADEFDIEAMLEAPYKKEIAPLIEYSITQLALDDPATVTVEADSGSNSYVRLRLK